MQSPFAMWAGLDTRKRVIVVVASLTVFIAVLGLSRMVATPGLSLLYAGLDGSQAGEVIAALDQEGVTYEVRGASVFVESNRRDELRMLLAGKGLPANSGAGYELLDSLSGFGTTSQMFDAAYWRAKEGELARTIVAHPNVKTARVHIASPASSPFQRGLSPTASVTVTTAGGELSDSNAKALKYLVASAVAGMQTNDVAIINGSTGQLIGGEDQVSASGASADLGADLKAKVERLMEARVGPGRAIVEVRVETVTDSESIIERLVDPESRVAISTDTEENESTSRNTGGAPVTVASNLPTGDANADGGESQAQSSQLRSRTNFEVSETTREITRGPGAVRRLTVAVLVDGLRGPEGWTPRSSEELEDLRALVASAVGFEEARGDVITLRSLELEPLADAGTAATTPNWFALALDPMRLIQAGVLALVALALGLFVVRPILAGRTAAQIDQSAGLIEGGVPVEATVADASDGTGDLPALSDGDGLAGGFGQPLPTVEDFAFDAPDFGASAMPSLDEDPVGHLKTLIEDRQPDTIEILKSWLEDDNLEKTS